MSSVIKIRALSKRNGKTISVASLIGLLITANFIAAELPVAQTTLVYVLLLLFTTGLGLGCMKLFEPDYSIRMDDIGVIYNHARGQWKAKWQDIQRVDIPSVSVGLERKELPYVGIKLKSKEFVLDNTSLRLASFLITEQRELVVLALKDDFKKWQCQDGSCPSEVMYDFEDVEIEGKKYKGLRAMFYRRMQLLQSKLGYDLFIPISALDREARDFLTLMRRVQQQSLNTANYT